MPTEPPVRITLRPPPHRDYLQGYPGIPPYSPQDDDDHNHNDPLLPLPKLERQLAHLTGTVEIRCTAAATGSTTGPIRAKWLSVELEKIEVVPPPPPPPAHGHADDFGDKRGGRKKKGRNQDTATEGRRHDEANKFVELIGTGPSKLWEATATASSSSTALRPVISISTRSVQQSPSTYKNRHGKKSSTTLGAKLGSVFFSRSRSSSSRSMGRPPLPNFQGDGDHADKEEEEEDDDDDDGGVDEDGYRVIPEGSYPFSIPLPEGLPPSVEIEEDSPAAAGFRRSGLKGISYQIVASLAVKSPKKSSLAKFSPSSTHGSRATNGAPPTLFVSSAPIYLDKADILPSWPAYSPLLPSPLPQRLPWAGSGSGVTMTTGETREATKVLMAGRGGEVSIKATRMTAAFGPGDPVRLWVQVAWGGEQPVKLTRLDFVLRESLTYRYPSSSNPSYIVRAPSRITDLVSASADFGNGSVLVYQHEPVAFEVEGVVPLDWKRMTVRTAKHIDISYHLKVRALLEQGDEELAIDHWPVIVANIPTRTANGIVREIGWVPGLCDRPGILAGAVGPVLARDFANGSPAPEAAHGSTARFRIANPSAASPSPSPSPAPAVAVAPVPPPQPVEPSPMAGFVPSTRAEEEKLRYYEQATRTRDVLQSSLRGAGSTTCGDSDRGQSMSPISPASTRLYGEETGAQVQTATRIDTASTRLLERSSTTVAWSGSEAGGATTMPAPVPSSTSPVSIALGRSLTVAEQEKARLYNQATSIARQRQAEARSQAELDEFERAQDAYERRLILEAEEERRREEERVKLEFEASERARIRAEEEQWRLEEEERRARAEAEREEKKRRAEQALADELRRFEEQRRAQSAQRAAELERQAEERRREDEMKRQRAEEMRRLDEERERAARAAEEEERRRRMAMAAMAEEEALRQRERDREREEAQHRRRRQEEEARLRRQEEEDRRRRREEAHQQELSELEQLRAEQQRLLEEREELRRALAARSPQGYGAPATSAPAYSAATATKTTSPIQRSPQPPLARASSVVSFAPSMSAANATAEAYAQAIRQQASTLSDEKAAYLRQLRQRTLTSSPPPPPPAGPAYPTPTSGGSIVSTLPPASSVSTAVPGAPPIAGGYKTAAEEKEEARRRRAPEEVTSPTTGDAPPPSYPAGSSVSSAPPVQSAAEEKAELQRYYAAKDAVDTAQQSREASTAPAYPYFARSAGNAPPLDSTDFTAAAAAASTESSSSCQDDQRDPSIAAGKRAAPLSSSIIASPSHWNQHLAFSPYTSTANGGGHGSGPEEDSAFEGLGARGSTRGNFPDYESVTQQIYDYHQQPGV